MAELTEQMPANFTDKARRAMTRAREEARVLDHTWIGTGHLLIGLSCERDGVAAQILASLGADLNRVPPLAQHLEPVIVTP